ncbi:MAG: hypothetical protein KDN22_25710 [Verrucomicrobiae bacterium]|nr:hypothetical protein [Verrucomicrobiae bacterium]
MIEKRMTSGFVALALSFIAVSTNASGAEGEVDSSFGDNGHIISGIGTLANNAFANAVAPNGDLLEAGVYFAPGEGSNIYVKRLHPDGTPETTFGADGVVTLDFDGSVDFAKAVTVQDDGRILVAGSTASGILVLRLLENGSLDESFGVFGTFADLLGEQASQIEDIAVQEDGSILGVGWARNEGSTNDSVVIRLLPDGSYDKTFNKTGWRLWDVDGGASDQLNAVCVGNGCVYAVGHSDGRAVALCLQDDGSLDDVFGDGGYFFPEAGGEAFDVCVDEAAGSLYLGGNNFHANGTFRGGFVCKVDSKTGAPAADFGDLPQEGFAEIRYLPGESCDVLGLLLLGEDIYCSGKAFNTPQGNYDVGLAALNKGDGSPDTDFGGNGDGIVVFDLQGGNDSWESICVNTASVPPYVYLSGTSRPPISEGVPDQSVTSKIEVEGGEGAPEMVVYLPRFEFGGSPLLISPGDSVFLVAPDELGQFRGFIVENAPSATAELRIDSISDGFNSEREFPFTLAPRSRAVVTYVEDFMQSVQSTEVVILSNDPATPTFSFTLTIEIVPFQYWSVMVPHFSDYRDLSLAAEPFDDGVSNFLKWTFGHPLDKPFDPSLGTLPVVTFDPATDGSLCIRTQYSVGSDLPVQVAPQVEKSGTGKDWEALSPDSPNTLVTTTSVAGIDTVIWEHNLEGVSAAIAILARVSVLLRARPTP